LKSRLTFTNLPLAPSVNNMVFSTMSVSVTAMKAGLNITECMLDEDYEHSYVTLQGGAEFEPKMMATRIQGRDIRLFDYVLKDASHLGGLMMHCDTYLGIDGAHMFDYSMSSGSLIDTTFVGNLFHMKKRQGLAFWIGFDQYLPTSEFSSHFINNT